MGNGVLLLDRLFDFISGIWDLFLFVEIIEEYERGVVLRWGRPDRDLEPGAHFYWPFHIERIMIVDVVPEARTLPEQRFTLRDGTTVAIRPVITFRVSNPRRHLIDVQDAKSSLLDVVAGVVRREMVPHSWSDLQDPEICSGIEKGILAEMKKEARKWGIEVEKAQYPDMVRLDGAYGIFGSSQGQHSQSVDAQP
jgi:regulator of protease activity HflC (stomatin/prohibitin superfamily)